MAVLEEKLWRGEPLMAIIKFDANTEYIVYTSSDTGTSGNFIKSVSFTLNEGNNSVNPLGIATSNSVDLEIYDVEDKLSPANTESPYYGKTVNGVEIDLYISYDEEHYEPYGVYFVTNWDGSYSDGGHDVVNVSAEDKLNSIGNKDMPLLPAYTEVFVGDLIANVMNGLGIGPTEYTIEESINEKLPYGTTKSGKVRDFFNNVCQLVFARVIINRQGIIRFVPATEPYVNSNEIQLDSEFTGSFTNKNTSNINYNRISVKYLLAGDSSIGELFNDNTRVLNNGLNRITDISFRGRALGIQQVKVLFPYDESGATIDSLKYIAYQTGMQLDITVSNGPITECSIVGLGELVSTTEKSVEVSVEDSSIVGGSTFEFDTQQMMSASDAKRIANKLRDYLKSVSRNVIMKGTALTPRLYVGDKVVISNTGTMYDGQYKIIGLSINMSEDYSLDATMIRI